MLEYELFEAQREVEIWVDESTGNLEEETNCSTRLSSHG